MIDIVNSPWQALACHYIKFYFSDIQPASMFRCIMDFQAFYKTPCFCRRILLYKDAGLWVLRLSITRMVFSTSGYMTSTRYFIFLPSQLQSGAPGHWHDASQQEVLWKQRCYMYHYGYIRNLLSGHRPGALAAVPCLSQQLVWFFIHADDRMHWVIREFIDIENIFHTCYEFCILFGGMHQ